MMFIKCCKHERKAKSWYITPQPGYVVCIMTFLRDCPACGRSAIRLDRWQMINKKLKYSPYQLYGGDAWDLYLKLKSLIISPYSSNKGENRTNLGYNYNEYGTIKKGYSGLSVMKLGKIKPNIDISDVKFAAHVLV